MVSVLTNDLNSFCDICISCDSLKFRCDLGFDGQEGYGWSGDGCWLGNWCNAIGGFTNFYQYQPKLISTYKTKGYDGMMIWYDVMV